MTAAPADPDAPERSLALLLVLFSMLAILAALFIGLVIAVVGFVDGGSHDEPLDRQAFEVFGLCVWFAFLAGPGCWIHGLVMGTHSWSRHRVTVGATVVPELLLGALAGVAVAFGYLTLDVQSLRPDSPDDWATPMRIAVVASSVVAGAALGASGGQVARITRVPGRSSWVLDVASIVLCYLVAAPLLGLVFTFAYETERSGGWEALGAPFVFVFATGLVSLGLVVHGVVTLLMTAAHQLLLGGKLSAIMDAFVGAVWALGVIVFGVAALDDGFENFKDPRSLAVAVLASIIFGAIASVAWGRLHRKLRSQRT